MEGQGQATAWLRAWPISAWMKGFTPSRPVRLSQSA